MIKYLAGVGLTLGLSASLFSPASAADCSLLAVLTPCAPAPSTPVPVPLEPVLAPLPLTMAPPVALDPQPAPVAPTPALAPGAPVPAAAARLLELVNGERARNGLGTLASSERIATIAAGHSAAMAERRDIWHNDAYFSAANRRALGATALGENVAMHVSADVAHARLMASPGHRANILDARFDAVGIAVVSDGAGMLYITQGFADWQGEPVSATTVRPAATPAPTRAAAPVAAPAARVAAPAMPTQKVPVEAAQAATFSAAAAPASDAEATASQDPVDATSAGGDPASPLRHLPIGVLAAALLGTVMLVAVRLGDSTLALS